MTTFNASELNADPNEPPQPGPAITPDDPEQLPDPDDCAVDAEVVEASQDDLITELAAESADLQKPEPEAVPGTTIALATRVDVSTLGEGWKHHWLEFKGDKLGIRLPSRQALAAFSLASSKYIDLQVKNDLTGLFIARHLSPESYGRVFSRLMDPDENNYTVDTVGALFNAIVTAAIKTDEPDTPPSGSVKRGGLGNS